MTAWGVVAVCAIGGGVAGPLLDVAARRVASTSARNRTLASSAGAVPVPAAPAPASTASVSAPLSAPVSAPATAPAEAPSPAQPPSPSRRGALVAEALALAVVVGGACALAAVRLGAVPQLAAYCVLFGSLAAISVADLRTGLVPRRLLYPGLLLVALALVAASAANDDWRRVLMALAGGAVAFFVFAAVWRISPRAMGFGDVRLAGLCGGALGWLGFAPVYLGFLAAFVAGTLLGVVTLTLQRRRRFPFAPALAVGTAFGVLWGSWLGSIWLQAR